MLDPTQQKMFVKLQQYVEENSTKLRKHTMTYWSGKLFGYHFRLFGPDHLGPGWLAVKGPDRQGSNWPYFETAEAADKYLMERKKFAVLATKHKI